MIGMVNHILCKDVTYYTKHITHTHLNALQLRRLRTLLVSTFTPRTKPNQTNHPPTSLLLPPPPPPLYNQWTSGVVVVVELEVILVLQSNR